MNQLEELDLSLNWIDSSHVHYNHSAQFVRLKSARKLTITVADGELDEVNAVLELPFTFDQIQEFKITFYSFISPSIYINPNDDFFSKNPLKKVQVISAENFTKIRGETADEVIEFLAECKNMKKFHFLLTNHDECAKVQKHLRYEWPKITVEDWQNDTFSVELER